MISSNRTELQEAEDAGDGVVTEDAVNNRDGAVDRPVFTVEVSINDAEEEAHTINRGHVMLPMMFGSMTCMMEAQDPHGVAHQDIR